MRRMLSIVTVFALLCLLLSCNGPEKGDLAEQTVKNSEGQTSEELPNLQDENGEIARNSKRPFYSGIEVHFIDVGQADAALILCDGKAMLIDGGNVADSSLIVAYLRRNAVSCIDYLICSHAHEDHVGGLSGALSAVKVGAVFAPVTESDSKAYQNFIQKSGEQGLFVQHPSPGEHFSFGEADISFFGPVAESGENVNNTSIVLKVTYGQTSFLFTGDAEMDAERAILSHDFDLSSTVLKVGHHGSDTSTSYVFLREVMPQYAVISVGKDNAYGHPSDLVLSRLRDVGAKVYRTDIQGDIVFKSDGKNLTVSTVKNQYTVTNPTEIDGSGQNAENLTGMYIGNKNSKKFHLPTCYTLPKKENMVLFDARSEALEAGYLPCGNCNP